MRLKEIDTIIHLLSVESKMSCLLSRVVCVVRAVRVVRAMLARGLRAVTRGGASCAAWPVRTLRRTARCTRTPGLYARSGFSHVALLDAL